VATLSTYRLQVLDRLPHPRRGFTQGLVVRGSTVWESTGLYGQSALHRYPLGAQQPERSAALPPGLFGEGICHCGDRIWQLTWRERVALRWDPQTMELAGTVPYNREGWGICQAGDRVVTSDGSSELIWRDPETLRPLGLIRVRLAGYRLDGLNDLDWHADRIWANVLTKPYLAGIDPASGEVTDVVDARSARERSYRDPEAVMNGISALAVPGEFLLTGKRWRWLYRVRLTESRRRRDQRPGRLLAG
jgi:glutamine cyclotransferase